MEVDNNMAANLILNYIDKSIIIIRVGTVGYFEFISEKLTWPKSVLNPSIH
jgi:hypothetical protein